MKKNIIVLAVIVVIGIGIVYYLANRPKSDTNPVQNQGAENVAVQNQNNNATSSNPTDASVQKNKPAADAQTKTPENKEQSVIGKSVGDRDIAANHYGAGEKEILFVGGTHGGYSWNTALLAYQLMDYLKANPSAIPGNIKVTVVPVLNPDGLSKVVDAAGTFKITDVSSSQEAKVAGRFNANNVDLNRNFDCNWKATGVWQKKSVSGGTAAFSEPESMAIKNYVQNRKLAAVIAWHSAGGGVYSSSCGNGILPETQAITDIYAKASGYPAYKNFESYQVSGDMTDWFAKNNVPAIGVLLSTHSGAEWDKNLAGIKALFKYYSK